MKFSTFVVTFAVCGLILFVVGTHPLLLILFVPLALFGLMLALVGACSAGFDQAAKEKQHTKLLETRRNAAQLKLMESAQLVLDDLNKPIVVPNHVPTDWQ